MDWVPDAAGPYIIKWNLEASKEESYDVVARILGENVEGILISCNDKVIKFSFNEKECRPKLILDC